ncbi:hypothetical protein D049_5190B, partial [Vibrio parahaemolyticus VPTS-2010]
ADLARAHLLE